MRACLSPIRLKIYPWQNQEVFKQAATGAVLSVASEMGFSVNGMLLPFSHPLTDALSRKNVSKLEKTSWQIIPLEATIYQEFISLSED